MDELSEVYKALSDPSRRRQLERLAGGPATSGQLADLLTMSRPAGSQHLAVLAAAELVQTTPVGRQRWHTLSAERLYRTRDWLDELLTRWETVLAEAPTVPVPIEPVPVVLPLRSTS